MVLKDQGYIAVPTTHTDLYLKIFKNLVSLLSPLLFRRKQKTTILVYSNSNLVTLPFLNYKTPTALFRQGNQNANELHNPKLD